MDLFNSMQDALDKGVTAVAGAVSGVAVENHAFMRAFARLCTDGWQQGWHERNGGNLTYRMTDAEVASCKPFFKDDPGAWVDLGLRADNLAGAHFVSTAAGCYFRNVEHAVSRNVGIVEIDGAGAAYRIVWGFEGDGVPTSEFASHVLNHSVRIAATEGESRVVYHAHPENVIALTKVMPLDERALTRALWKATTESVIAFPEGVGVVACMVPGKMEIARATSELMKTYAAVIWAQHGLFATGSDFDAAFGLMHAIEKAASVHGKALMMNGGSDAFANTIEDGVLRSIAHAFDLPINEAFLEQLG